MMRRFEASDLPEINRWATARGLAPARAETLPRVGLIVPGVACLFLFQTDAALALVHMELTNPDAPLRQRHRGIVAMTEEVQRIAREAGIRQLITWASGAGPVRRAVRNGGRIIEQGASIIAKEL